MKLATRELRKDEYNIMDECLIEIQIRDSNINGVVDHRQKLWAINDLGHVIPDEKVEKYLSGIKEFIKRYH